MDPGNGNNENFEEEASPKDRAAVNKDPVASTSAAISPHECKAKLKVLEDEMRDKLQEIRLLIEMDSESATGQVKIKKGGKFNARTENINVNRNVLHDKSEQMGLSKSDTTIYQSAVGKQHNSSSSEDDVRLETSDKSLNCSVDSLLIADKDKSRDSREGSGHPLDTREQPTTRYIKSCKFR